MSYQPNPSLTNSSTTGTSTTNVNLGRDQTKLRASGTSDGDNSTAVVASGNRQHERLPWDRRIIANSPRFVIFDL